MPDVVKVRPLVSVVMPVHNEAEHIREVLSSVFTQSCSTYSLELLVVDGESNDGTSEILQEVAGSNSSLKVLSNPRQKTPFAFNIGLQHAQGEYVCIFGAHTAYDSDYIAVCLEELKNRDAVGCGGRVLTTAANASLRARLIAAAVGSSFGTSRRSFRNHPEGYADTVNYPVYIRQAVLELGGYDEELHRNQDIDLNQRLRARGYRLYMTWKTGCRYFVQGTIRQLMRYGWHNGYWNFISLKKNRRAHALYHFIPAIFMAAFLVTGLMAFVSLFLPLPNHYWYASPFALLLVSYGSAALLASKNSNCNVPWYTRVFLPIMFFALHAPYGLGTLWALAKNAKSPSLVNGLKSMRKVDGSSVTNS